MTFERSSASWRERGWRGTAAERILGVCVCVFFFLHCVGGGLYSVASGGNALGISRSVWLSGRGG